MTRCFWLARTAAFAGVMLCMSWRAGALWCQERDGQVPSQFRQSYPPPGPCPTNCVPKVNTWGHFPTKWRQWPGEQHPEQTNPRSVGKEVIPTPQGREEVPLPKTVLPQQRLPSPEGQAQPPEAGQIVPPEGLLIPKKPPEELLGQPSAPPPSTPAPGEGLPGLPSEPAPSAPQGKPSPNPTPSATPNPTPNPTPSPTPSPTPNPTPSPTPNLSPSSLPSPVPDLKTPSAPAPKDTNKPAADQKSSKTSQLRPVPLICDIEPERNRLSAGVYRADSIDAVPPTRSADRVELAGYTTVESSFPLVAESVSMPRVALGGYCPVELSRHSRWAPGDLRWTVVYKGWIYRFSGAEQRQQFLANPNSFAPVNSCNDPVLSVDERRTVAGQTAYCAVYGGRLYMFSSTATQAQFNRNPQRYATGSEK